MTPRKPAKPYQIIKVRDFTHRIEFTRPRNPYSYFSDTDRTPTYIEVSADLDHTTLLLDKPNYRIQSNPTDPLAHWTSRDNAIYMTCPEAVADAENAIAIDLAALPGKLRKGKRHPAYKEMSAHVKSEVKHYQVDFTYYDTLTLASEPEPTRPFVWLTRECGTYLLHPTADPSDAGIEILNYERKDPTAKYYHWTGAELEPITEDKATYIYRKGTQS